MTEIQRPFLSDKAAREQFFQTLLNDEAVFGRYARRYMDADAPGPDQDGFLEWSWNRYQDEQPAYTKAWTAENRPTEFNFKKSWEEEIYGKEDQS